MEVHPPHEPIHTWRQFFLHLFTITVGLLIALGLEAAAEAVHHRHLLRQAQRDLRQEMTANRQYLAMDERQLTGATQQFIDNLRLLDALRAHTATKGELGFRWSWDGMQSSAWDTARDTGALALMPYEDAQGFAVVYGQQETVNKESEVYIADIYRIRSPLQGGRKLSDLQPAEFDTMIANTQQTLSDIQHLGDLCKSLDKIYADAGPQ
jgi:type II secretory pathway pseudopilin PulG